MALPTERLRIIFILIAVVSVTGCARLRNVPPGEAFLRRHEVKVHDKPKEYSLSSDDLLAIAKPEPNRRILWFRFNHTVYLMVNKKKLARSEEKNAIKCEAKNAKRAKKNKAPKECKSWRMFWAYTVGEPTVLVDSARIERSAEQMSIHLQKRGFFRAAAEPEFDYNKKGNKCKVIYHVYPNQPYFIRSIRHIIDDKEMNRLFEQVQRQLVMDTGMVFNLDKLNAERDVITNFYNDRGYYEFNREYISYDADTSAGHHQVALTLRIQNPRQLAEGSKEEYISVPHRKYYIGKIYVDSNFDLTQPDKPHYDTLEFNGMYIFDDSTSTISRYLLSCIQNYSEGDMYKKTSIDNTYKRYSQLGVFRATTIMLVPRRDPLSPHIHLLDTYIRATPEERQGFSIDPHVTNRAGNMGIYVNPGYINKNIFRGAERLEIRMIVGMEASQTLVQTTDASGSGQIRRSFGLNTFEIGPEVTLRLPRLWPLGCDYTSSRSDPQTAVTALFNYQVRPDYERTLSQFRYAYNFIENPDKITRINLDMVEFSIIKIRKSIEFQEFLDRLNDSFLANSYQNHLILSFITPGLTWNTQKAKFQRRYFFWKSQLGGAGNILNGIMQLTATPRDEIGSYELTGIRYAQYYRGESDFRYYINVNNKNAFVMRAYAGMGVPRKNLSTLPFEKSFFSGGSNGMRAWQARTLGPGSSRDTLAVQTFNNIGEIKLEGNFEYRFKMTQMLNWALFVDAGNIWLLNPDPIRPGADFSSERFLSEIALSGGLGLRLDFDIFLVRFDLGLKLKDPAKVPGERWIGQPKDEYIAFLQRFDPTIKNVPLTSNVVFNLGIGFPF